MPGHMEIVTILTEMIWSIFQQLILDWCRSCVWYFWGSNRTRSNSLGYAYCTDNSTGKMSPF